MNETNATPAAPGARTAVVRAALGRVRLAYAPVLVTYFAYGASTVTAIALLYLQKDTLRLTPAEVAEVGFWLGLPWSMKMVAGAASDAYPIFGSRRAAYLLLGVAASVLGYAFLATAVDTKGEYLLAMVLVTSGYMIQDVVADALSVEVAESDEEIGQVQTLGRMALLAGSISVGYLSGWLADRLGPRPVFAIAVILPLLVALSAALVRPRPRPAAPAPPAGLAPSRTVIGIGLGYAALGVVLQAARVPAAQEIVLVVSGALIALLLWRLGISRSVVVAAAVIFLFRATPTVGQGYSYWAIDRLGFDQEFLGVLAQVGSVVSLAGLIAFRKTIVTRPVSFTLAWVIIAGAILYLPNIGLFYGLADWLGVTPRTLAFIDTTISAPLAQLAMVPMLVLIARSTPPGGEATMFAIMASLMNLALSASELFTRYLNSWYHVTQADYANLGRLMITVTIIGLVPLGALPMLRRQERAPGDRPPSSVDARAALRGT
jgi:MFS family permease